MIAVILYIVSKLEWVLDWCTANSHMLGFLICFGGVTYQRSRDQRRKYRNEKWKKDWDNIGKIRLFFVPFSQEVIICMLVLHIMYLMLCISYVYVYLCMYVLGINMKQNWCPKHCPGNCYICDKLLMILWYRERPQRNLHCILVATD